MQCLLQFQKKALPTVDSALFSRWLRRHGLPLEIVSDNGTEFCNEIVETLLQLIRIKKTNTTLYHPKTSAQAAVCNKTIAAYLKTQVLSSILDWENIALMMFAYNTSYHRSIR
jgi:transposase InsO family protein